MILSHILIALLDECCIGDIDSVWCRDWFYEIYMGHWLIFHTSVMLIYIPISACSGLLEVWNKNVARSEIGRLFPQGTRWGHPCTLGHISSYSTGLHWTEMLWFPSLGQLLKHWNKIYWCFSEVAVTIACCSFQTTEADVVDRLMSCIKQAAPLFSVSKQ